MKLSRSVALGLLGGAIAVWLAAAATTGTRTVTTAPAARPNAVDASGDDLRAEIARLHERLRPTAAPLQTRDLFHYSRSRGTVAAVSEATAPSAVVLPVPDAPLVKLVGIAEDAGPDGPVRTAMLSSNGELVFAREGETVPPRFRVLRISTEVVELTDETAGNVVRLALK